MPRKPCPRAVAAENRAFLRHLRRTGNAHEAARALGLSRTRFTKRRAKDSHFATAWDQALTLAHADLNDRARGKPTTPQLAQTTTLRETRHGRLQLRRPGGRTLLTPDHEQRFLLALSATANVRLASAAAGLSPATFYARRRRDRAFAREWRAALAQAYDRIEAALLASFDPEAHAAADWAHNDPPELPPMTVAQALQLLHLHQKEARLLAEPLYLKRRRGEGPDAHAARLAAMRAHADDQAREAFRRAEALRQVNGADNPHHRWVLLPDLAQVTGWSAANPTGKPHDPNRALFGGWRLRDWEERRKRER